MDENRIGERVLGCALKVHSALGPGLLESAYGACLARECDKASLNHKRQIVLQLVYDGEQIDVCYRLDLLVEGRVVVEVKAVQRLVEIHQAQLLSYLKLGGDRLGYLLKFQRSENEGRHLALGERTLMSVPLRSSASSAVK